VTDYSPCSDEIPDMHLIERLLPGHRDAGQLIAIISRSYDYFRKLPLKGLIGNSSKENPDLFEVIS
jgi:hypothetical protein